MPEPDQPILALGKTRYLGEPVALVVADTVEHAQLGAQKLLVTYEILPAIMSLAQALSADSETIWEEWRITSPSNTKPATPQQPSKPLQQRLTS